MSNNQYSIGKYLRKQKNLKQHDQKAKIIELSPLIKSYIQYLKSKGLQIFNIKLAQFYTKNGLPYTGIIATDLIPSNQIFMRIPVNLLLNTRIAYFSDIKRIFDQNPHVFHSQFTDNWQDRIILVFLLYEYQKQKKSQWFHLINNLSRDIDYVIFWKQQEIKLLKDKIFEKMIQKSRLQLKKQIKLIRQTLQKYKQIFLNQTYTQENIKWLHIHLITRCFGKFLAYVTMVPFAELLNHQCTDVYYDLQYFKQNPNNPGQIFEDPKILTQQQQKEFDSSEGTYDSQQYQSDSQFFQFQQNLNLIEQNQFKKIIIFLRNKLNFSDYITPFFVNEVLRQIKKLKSDINDMEIFLKGQQDIMNICNYYYQQIKVFYKKIKKNEIYSNNLQKRTKQNLQLNEQKCKPQNLVDKNKKYFGQEKQWKKDLFDNFVMKCSHKDQFKKGSQVYFCYGRLSNRMLLLRYGIALQHNKYNHIYINLQYKNFIFPNTLQFYSMYKISRLKKFKIKRTKICLELLSFLRSKYWKYNKGIIKLFYPSEIDSQLKILNQYKLIMQEQIKKLGMNKKNIEVKLFDKNLNYHQYFATIYVLQKYRVIQNQINLIKIAIAIIQNLKKNKASSIDSMFFPHLQKQEQKKRNRIMMKDYIDSFKFI